jgi:hypothetical protein
MTHSDSTTAAAGCQGIALSGAAALAAVLLPRGRRRHPRNERSWPRSPRCVRPNEAKEVRTGTTCEEPILAV